MAYFLCSAPLSSAQLKQLEVYRYSPSGRSLLEPPCQIYWNWLVRQIPMWVAPNALSMAGLLVNIASTLLLVFFCPTATEEAPAWAFVLSALGLFVYQSLDAIDGKQARRTNVESALDEHFDHGCDAVSTVFVAVGTCISCGIGRYPHWTFFCGFIGMFMFFCAHWQTYVSGTVRFGLVDVTEVQFAIIVMYLMSAFGGVSLWQTTLPLIGLQLYVFPVMGIIGGGLYSCHNNFHVILNGGAGKGLTPGLHIGLILTLAFIIFKKSPSQLFEHHPCFYLLAFGMVIAKLSNKLVVAHITKSELHLPDTAFVGPGLLFLNQLFDSFVDEYVVLWIATVLSLADLTRYFTGVCRQIAGHLGMRVFSITPPDSAHRD
ncbi:cholinephosphotransferase 1-like [Syngnathus typhle]|uniref:cholinephosphotransferase 1-like n=1 Tax=Syngnathus typhle TaxID=161592 RepID=UPI002A69D09B|nr:cholinephosphotransferase 1-like [Syngnathus typhle]